MQANKWYVFIIIIVVVVVSQRLSWFLNGTGPTDQAHFIHYFAKKHSNYIACIDY